MRDAGDGRWCGRISGRNSSTGVDEIILFHRLKREQMGTIVDIQLKRLQKLLDDRKITLELDDAARKWLADKGYDPAYGARPLKRVDPEAGAGPAGREDPAGRGPRRRQVKITAGTDRLLFLPKPAAVVTGEAA